MKKSQDLPFRDPDSCDLACYSALFGRLPLSNTQFCIAFRLQQP